MKTLEIKLNKKNETIIEGLTSKESMFFTAFLSANGCGALTPADLLLDNFSCQAIEDLRETTGLSNHQIGGLLSSLQEKQFIYVEVRKGDCDLYWVSDHTLEELPQEWDFTKVAVDYKSLKNYRVTKEVKELMVKVSAPEAQPTDEVRAELVQNEGKYEVRIGTEVVITVAKKGNAVKNFKQNKRAAELKSTVLYCEGVQIFPRLTPVATLKEIELITEAEENESIDSELLNEVA